ncbi:hypothetical protein PPYR_07356 [Photinus pyralis]|uniref:Uncharacterized protein n=2 Tax=Photinus pyralis TaxID=7054 RepID=A0A5N4AQA3_PHOPY|nr:hypothetical protein PPYR_07356 [Photinus pyralis]
MLVAAEAAPGGLDFGFPSIHSAPFLPAPVFPAPVLPAPTIVKSFSAPVFSPPIIKAPIVAPAPIIKTIAPIPIVKQIAPATSYASITQYAVAPVVKTVVAPQPIFKSFAVAAPLPAHGFPDFHH